MLVAYVTVLLILVTLQFLFWWKSSGLEKKYVRLAAEVDGLTKLTTAKGGGKPCLSETALNMHQLALAAERRDRTERRYTFWQAWVERMVNWRKSLVSFRGKLSPYLAGVFDLSGVLVTLHVIGVDVGRVRTLIGL